MKVHIGILGDPAKLELYDDRFYSLVQKDETQSLFYLLGASERGVKKSDYKLMFDRLKSHLNSDDTYKNPFKQSLTGHNSRVGLFPSSAAHLIDGPSFVLAPFPYNSRSFYLRFKSQFLRILLTPFTKKSIISLAYFPLGGKAAERTKAKKYPEIDELAKLFYTARRENKFSWYYLEAGSGEKKLLSNDIEKIMLAQYKALNGYAFTSSGVVDGEIKIIPNSIYGGGINSVEMIKEILYPNTVSRLIPHCLIIGNISEIDVEMTMSIIKSVNKFNKSYSM